MKKCCDNPDVRMLSLIVEQDKKYQVDVCENCNTKTEPYELELGQAIFGNPVSEFDFDNMEDSSVTERMIRIISYFATGDSSYSDSFQNDIFELRSYYCGDDEELEVLPNFKHKESGLEVRWYKYIGRGMSINRNICPKCFYSIFVECMNSIMK